MTTLEFSNQLIGLEDNLRRYAMILTLNSEDANDLLQDTFLRALDNKDKYMSSQYKNLRGWTYTIMKNIFINNYRRIKNRKDKIENVSFDNSSLFENAVNDNFENKIQLNELNDAINNLQKQQKVPLVMYLLGYKYKEIADKLNLNIGTVKSRIFFARNSLKKII